MVMKRLIGLLFMLLPFVASAQDQSLEFFYIAHDRTTPVNDLCDRLEYVYETALSYEDQAVIFYLPNYDQPIVVTVNLPGDNRDDFKKIISELRVKPSHEAYIDVDIETITNILNTHDFITDDGEARFTSVNFCWYVNPDFWVFQYNESLIANIYFTFDMNQYHKSGYMTTEIWHAEGDGLEERIDRRRPFGSKNLCSSMLFILQQY